MGEEELRQKGGVYFLRTPNSLAKHQAELQNERSNEWANERASVPSTSKAESEEHLSILPCLLSS